MTNPVSARITLRRLSIPTIGRCQRVMHIKLPLRLQGQFAREPVQFSSRRNLEFADAPRRNLAPKPEAPLLTPHPGPVDISASDDREENLVVSDLREIAERQNEIPIHPDIPAGYGSSLRRAIWQEYPRAASSLQSSAATFYSCRFGSITSASQTWNFPLKRRFCHNSRLGIQVARFRPF